jgi:thermolysin
VHFSQNLDNAFWDPTQQGMFYGDGGQRFRALSAGLDVVAHEFTHGVTASTSNLMYENQAGALNEAVSDIFGCFIEHSVNPDPVKNWQIGEHVTLEGGVLRDMMNPASVAQPQPASMSTFVNTQQDNGGVHVNSGIINNAAYLMTMGGKNPDTNVTVQYGIGWEKSEQVWFRANTKYFIASTNFGQAAQGVLQAARDVGLSQNEINIVDCAFKAVGVAQGSCAEIVNPTSTTPAPTTGAAPGTSGSAAPASGGDTGDGETTTTSSPSRRRRLVTSESAGCNASGSAGDLGGFGLVVAAAALVTKRRRRTG